MQALEINDFETPRGAVQFDSEAGVLVGRYTDELSLFRARRVWQDVLKSVYILETDTDFTISPARSSSEAGFVLTCSFTSACGRYAFWRLINYQTPEAQYRIETAHIAAGAANHAAIVTAPDLAPLPGTVDKRISQSNPKTARVVGFLRRLFGQA